MRSGDCVRWIFQYGMGMVEGKLKNYFGDGKGKSNDGQRHATITEEEEAEMCQMVQM